MSSELRQAIDKLLSSGVVNRHSYFQLKYFVVGKEPTIQAKMWRCVKELEARNESLRAIELEILDTKDNIELADIEIGRLKEQMLNLERGLNEKLEVVMGKQRELDIKEAEVHLRKRQRQKQALEVSLTTIEKKRKETEEEAIFFLRAFESLQKVEPLKPYDDLEEQTKYWNEKLTQLTNLKVLLHLPLDTELVQTIMSLSDDCAIKTEIVKLLESERKLIEDKKAERYQGNT